MKLANNHHRVPACEPYRAFRDILDNRRIAIVYQPIVSLTTGDMMVGSADARAGRNALCLALGAVIVCCRGGCAGCPGADLPGRGVAPGTIPSAGVQALSQCYPEVFRGSCLCQRGIQPNGCASGGLRRMTWCWRLPATPTSKRCEKWPRIFSRWIVPSFPAWTETGETGRLGRHCRVRPKDELPGDRRRNRAESGTGDGDAPGG